MRNEWILDVLADLRAFATANNFDALASELDGTLEIARSELAAKYGLAVRDSFRDKGFSRTHRGQDADREDAR